MSESLRKAGGVLELCLQTHQRMMKAIDFLPEFCIVSAQEIIPGLQKSEGKPVSAFCLKSERSNIFSFLHMHLYKFAFAMCIMKGTSARAVRILHVYLPDSCNSATTEIVLRPSLYPISIQDDPSYQLS